MIVAPYEKDKDVDSLFSHIITNLVPSKLNDAEDDFLLLCVGTTGTGKSALSLHAVEAYLKNEASVDYYGLNKSSFAKALKQAKDKQLPRMVVNDEANISKRDSLSKYNKDLIDLYLSIRGLRIFHWWNNPSVDMIDKHFIEERIKGMVFITTKDIDRPRIYYYFRKEDLLRMWEKYENLKLNTLNKVKKEYAYYRGWFKDYKGFLLEAYKEKKGERMNSKIEVFFNKYGTAEDYVKPSEIARDLMISSQTVKNYAKQLISDKIMPEEYFIRNSAGSIKMKKESIPFIEQRALESKERRMNFNGR